MTTDEVKKFIVDKREDGHKFESIANMLNDELGDKKYTRQSVYGLYSRYIERLKREDTFDKLDIDIVNVYCRLNTISGTTKFLNQANWYDIKIYDTKTNNILYNQKQLIQEINQELVDIVCDGILTGDSPEEIIERLDYKGVKVKDKVYRELLVEAYSSIIKKEVENIVSGSMVYCKDRSVAKKLLEKFPTGDSLTVVLNRNLKR